MRTSILALLSVLSLTAAALGQRQMEYLDRGTVAVRLDEGKAYVGWRLLGTDPEDTSFNVYRQTEGGQPEKVNAEPLRGATNLIDSNAPADTTLAYMVRPVVGGEELPPAPTAAVADQNYWEIPIQPIENYRVGDVSVGDLDGDGQLDLVVQQRSRPRDNGSAGVTATTILDGYKLDGTHLWRIDLGKNIREGEHYTQFMVYDLDGDGHAEVACKTADGTIDGVGHVIGDAEKDWRTLEDGSRRNGRILDGPEYFTDFRRAHRQIVKNR